MTIKTIIKLIILLPFLTNITCCAQNSSKIAGQYKLQGSAMIINPDNTFLIVAYGTVVKGTVEFQDTIVKLIPYKPKVPFVLYGRKNQSKVSRNTIMFQSFNEAQTLINYDENNKSLQKMKHVFNLDANCIDYPNVLNNFNNNAKFYFAIKDQKEVYEFENNQGFNDFIVLYLPEKNKISALYFMLNKEKNAIMYDGKEISKEENLIKEADIKQIMGMYDRVFSESENYYCNPAYNFFEEKGIDLSQYKKEKYKDEYYFVNKYNDRGDKNEYQNIGIIYEYKKVNPKILVDKTYSLDTNSVFNFNCKE